MNVESVCFCFFFYYYLKEIKADNSGKQQRAAYDNLIFYETMNLWWYFIAFLCVCECVLAKGHNRTHTNYVDYLKCAFCRQMLLSGIMLEIFFN